MTRPFKTPINPHTSPYEPMESYNGLITRSPRRSAPTTDLDFRPREWRHLVSVGFIDVQLRGQGTQRKRFTGLRLNQVDYLYASAPTIPGQNRDNYGGYLPRGIDPLSWQKIVDAGPGSQPTAPGGPGTIAGQIIHNPYAGGG